MDKTIRYRRHHIRQSIRRFNKNVPSVYITHQLNVMTGNTTWLTSKLHQSIIKKYTECWVRCCWSTESGRRIKSFRQALLPKYIGMLSRMHKKQPQKNTI
jgi:hypothetical protein